MSFEGTKNTGHTRWDEGKHPDDSEPADPVSDIEESATLIENDKQSEGDDSFYQEFNEINEIPNMIPDSQSGVNLRRSSGKTCMPKKFSDFKVDSKVKYSIDKHVNYSILSVENFNFSTSINKIVEPKTFDEASKDIRWIKAMNLEMEALNRNGTWIITELPVGRKSIGNKWVSKVKYKLAREVERFKARLVAKGYNQKEGNNNDEINKFTVFLSSKFMIKDLGKLKCFLGIEVLEFNDGLVLTQKKYCLELLTEFGMLACKTCGIPIKFKEGVKSKKQFMLFKSSAEAEYRAMNSVTCKVMWILKILVELNVNTSLPVPLHCDNSSAIQIAANPVFYEMTKHFEIKLFFLREKVASGIVKTIKIKSADNTADIFTKGLIVVDHNKFCENLGLKYLYRFGLWGNIKNTNPNHVLRIEGESKSKSKG
nr:ribonuclease H-like domain-containing protein [Tanacetum cinerariifolium]